MENILWKLFSFCSVSFHKITNNKLLLPDYHIKDHAQLCFSPTKDGHKVTPSVWIGEAA